MSTALRSLPLAASAAVVTSFVRVSTAFAQFAGPDPDIEGTPGQDYVGSTQAVRDVVLDLLITVLNFLALVAVIMVVIAGIRLIVSQGDEEASGKAKKTIMYALIGLAVVLFARVIVGLITSWLAGNVA